MDTLGDIACIIACYSWHLGLHLVWNCGGEGSSPQITRNHRSMIAGCSELYVYIYKYIYIYIYTVMIMIYSYIQYINTYYHTIYYIYIYIYTHINIIYIYTCRTSWRLLDERSMTKPEVFGPFYIWFILILDSCKGGGVSQRIRPSLPSRIGFMLPLLGEF